MSELNPTGTIKQLDEIEAYLKELMAKWDAEQAPSGNWFTLNRVRLVKGVLFIINALDELIQKIDDLTKNGEDKKATVIAVVSILFDYIIVQGLPFYLKFFEPKIRYIIIDVIISGAIDFIVGKYRNGIWSKSVKKM